MPAIACDALRAGSLVDASTGSVCVRGSAVIVVVVVVGFDPGDCVNAPEGRPFGAAAAEIGVADESGGDGCGGGGGASTSFPKEATQSVSAREALSYKATILGSLLASK